LPPGKKYIGTGGCKGHKHGNDSFFIFISVTAGNKGQDDRNKHKHRAYGSSFYRKNFTFHIYCMVYYEVHHPYITCSYGGQRVKIRKVINKGIFKNLQADSYWSCTEYKAESEDAWDFHFFYGYQGNEFKGGNGRAMAVHPGVVSAVPTPGALLLLSSGLAVLATFRKGSGRARGIS